MTLAQPSDRKRKRAPSKRALATRERVLDAAETVFAQRGFDGATIREIASEADEPIGTIHHHGGGKEALFHKTVARRADALSRARLKSLELAKSDGELTLEAVLSAFIRPFFDLSKQDPRWREYARLVAFVSVDDRWRELSAFYFDPTARDFIKTIGTVVPDLTQAKLAQGFVFTVSAMLALLTSDQRIDTLSAGAIAQDEQIDHLIQFCAAGFRA